MASRITVCQFTILVLLLLGAVGQVAAATGVQIDLGMPATRLSSFLEAGAQPPLSISDKPLPLFKSNFRRQVEANYNDKNDLMVVQEYYGDYEKLRIPVAAQATAYQSMVLQRSWQEMWRASIKKALAKPDAQRTGGLLRFDIPWKSQPKLVRSIIGEGGAGLQVNGYRKITISGKSQWNDQTSVATAKQSKFPSLNMEQIASFTIKGNIGSKITVDVNQDSKRQQSLANKILLRYKGDEDDVVQNIELGNTNLSLPSTRFTGYSQSIQGLFGVKANAQVGALSLTAIASQEKSSNEGATFSAGAESTQRVIRDYQFMDNRFFDLRLTGYSAEDMTTLALDDLLPGDSITKLVLYLPFKDEGIAYKCSLYVNPNQPLAYQEESLSRSLLPETEYEAQPSTSKPSYIYHDTEHYILVDRPTISNTSNNYFGVYMEAYRPSLDSIVTIGNETGVVGEGEDAETFKILKLIKHERPDTSYVTWNYVWRNVYSLGGRIDDPDNLEVQIFKGQATTVNDMDDSEVPHNSEGESYLHLMGLDENDDGVIDRSDQIVDYSRGLLRFPSRAPFVSDVLGADTVPTIYNSDNSTQLRQDSKYYLLVNSSSRATEFSLGHFDIIEGSETVMLNGRRLTPGVDYRMHYEIGRISFLSQEALDPNANVTVDYEYAPLISAEKKTLLGARAEYARGRNLKAGTTVLYKSEKTTDRKPRIGEEQSRFINLDYDLSYSFESKALTKLVNALPLVETEVASRVSFAGEIGQSFPNPNVLGEAFIDDFEGSRERYSLGVTRGTWHPGSRPENVGAATVGKLIWYNPYVQYRVTDVYDREVRAGEDRIHVLEMEFDPQGEDKPASWGGVMKALSSGVWDQSRTQFIELRLAGREGILHIDLGEITEDLNGNGEIDTEEKGFHNGILEEGEDVGLDGLSDEEEREVCECSDDDPAGDNWAYDSDDPNNYDNINGTEGNALDPETYGLPDTEDLNRSSGLDNRNNYYSYEINLSDNPYVVEGSERNDWYTIRIPFTEEDADAIIGTPRNDNIQFARMWIEGVDTTVRISIAQLELTRNLWELRPVRVKSDSTRDSITAPAFRVAVINSEENPDLYSSPPGVEGFYDKTTGLTEKEQSLSIEFENFVAGDTGIAVKIPFRKQDLTGYQKIEMWAHGDRDRDSIKYFLRVGNDSLNYYEYNSPIISGWSQSHSVSMVFDEITQLKLKQEELDTNEVSEGNYRVFGSPSFTKIKYYAVGIIKEGGADIDSGTIWLDELRVTDVRNDAGIAGFVSGSINFADLFSVSADYSREDAFFRKLTARDRTNLGSGRENTSQAFRVSFNADRLLPQELRARIPINYNWSRTTTIPRLITGSDIAVPTELAEAQKTVSTSYSVSIKESFNAESENLFFKYLLNQFSSGVTLSKSSGRTPTQPVNESERYNANAKYDIPLQRHSGLPLFWPLQYVPFLPEGLTKADLWPLPTRFSANGTVDRTRSLSVNSFGKRTPRYTRTFKGKISSGMDPLPGVKLSYTMDTDRDLDDPELLKFSFNPSEFKLGQERTFRENFTAAWSPRLLAFITGTRFNFGATHSENLDPERQRVAGTRQIDNSRNLSMSASFDINKLIGTGSSGGGGGRRSSRPRPRQQREEPIADTLGTEEDKAEEEDETGPGTPFYEYPWRALRYLTKRIDPVAGSFKRDKRISRNGFTERPQLFYRWGLSSDPQADVLEVETGTAQVNNESKSVAYSLGSGVALPLGVKVTTRWAFSTSEASNRHIRDETTTFPELGFDYGNLFILRWTNLFASSFKLDSKYTRSEKKQVNKAGGFAENSTRTENYSPLLQATISWKFASSFTSRLNYNKTTNDRQRFVSAGANIGDLDSRTVNYVNAFTVSNSYTFKGGSRISIPLLGSMKIKASLSLNLDVSYSTNRSEKRDPDQPVSEIDNKSDLTVQTRASYSFSQNIKGGMTARWRDSTDKKTARNTHGRELGLWVEIRF